MARDLNEFVVTHAFHTEEAIAFVQDLADLMTPGKQRGLPPANDTIETEQSLPLEAAERPTVSIKARRSPLRERFRTSRLGRFLLGD